MNSKQCPDCKDGFYYPLTGSKEPCPTCISEVDQFKLDFKNHFLKQIKNIDLNSIRFEIKNLPRGKECIIKCVVRDIDYINKKFDRSAKGLATYFYKYTQSVILNIINGKRLIFLDFIESSIAIYYDFAVQSHIMRLQFFTEIIK